MTIRIKGPKPPSGTEPDAGKVDKLGAVEGNKAGAAGLEASGGAAFDSLLAPERAAAASESSATPTTAPQLDRITELAARVERGEVTPAAATGQIVDQLVQVRGAGLDVAGKQRLREHLEKALSEDPTLLARMARIGRAQQD